MLSIAEASAPKHKVLAFRRWLENFMSQSIAARALM